MPGDSDPRAGSQYLLLESFPTGTTSSETTQGYSYRSPALQLPTFTATHPVTVGLRWTYAGMSPTATVPLKLFILDTTGHYAEVINTTGTGTASGWMPLSSSALDATIFSGHPIILAFRANAAHDLLDRGLVGVDSIQFYMDGQPIDLPILDDQTAGLCECDIARNPHVVAADPIDTFNGAYLWHGNDLGLQGGMGLAMNRSYSSAIADPADYGTSPFGAGWRFDYGARLVLPTQTSDPGWISGAVTLDSGQGAQVPFYAFTNGVTYDKATFYEPPAGVQSQLTANASGPYAFTLTTASQRQFQFDSQGRLAALEAGVGLSQTLQYGAVGGLSGDRLLGVTDMATGRHFSFTWTSDHGGRITQVTGSDGSAVAYTYSALGDLRTASQPFLVGQTPTIAMTYTMDLNHRLTQIDQAGLSTPLIQNTFTGGVLTHQIEASGAVLDRSLLPDPGSGGSTMILTRTGALGSTDVMQVGYRRDQTPRLISQNDQFVSYHTFDQTFGPTTQLDGAGRARLIDHNDLGQVTRVALDGVNDTTLLYDGAGNLLRQTAPTGVLQSRQYTATNALTALVQQAADGSSTLTTTLGYTGGDYTRPTAVTAPDGTQTTYGYDSLGQLTQVVQHAGTTAALTTTYGYDGAGRVITTTQGVGTPEATTSRTFYRADGQVERTYRNWTWTGAGYPTPGQTENVLDAVYGYDAAGRQIWTQRADGIYTRYTQYDGAGRVAWTVQHPVNAQGAPVIPTSMPSFDPARPDANIVTGYGYDDLNRVSLITQTGILTGSFNVATERWSAATQRVTKVEYDALSRPVTRTLNYQPGLGGTVPDANVATYTYYDGANNIIWQSNAAGYWTHTDYDALNRPVTTTVNYENGDPLTVDPANVGWTNGVDTDLVSVTEYAADGQVARTIANYVDGVWSATEPLTDRITLPEYDAFGRVVTQTVNDAPGSTTTDTNLTSVTRYDVLTGRVAATQDTLGQWTVPQYDAIGRTTHTIQNCRDAFGNPAWTGCVTPSNRTDRSVPTNQPASGYDGLGRATLQTDVLGRVTRTQYDALGRVVATTQNYVLGAPTTAVTNVTTLTSYSDALGTRVTTTDPLGATTSRETLGLGHTTVTTDTQGLVARSGMRWTRTPSGLYTIQQIDGLGRTVATVVHYQNGVHTSADSPDQDLISTVEYDQAGRQVATTTPDGRRTEYRYDGRGLLTAVQENVLTSGCTAGRTDCNVTTYYTYDRAGNRIAITDANGHTRTFAYDALGRQIAATDALAVTTGYVYDAASRLVAVDDPRGSTYDVTQTYDELGRVLATTSGSGTTLAPITHTYDLASRPLSMGDASGLTTYGYDPLGRVDAVTTGQGTLGYEYNARGQRTALAYPSGTTVAYSYLPSGQLDTVTQGGTTLADYAYDAQTGRLSGVTQPHGMATTYGYDALGRLTGLVRSQSGTTLQSFASTFSLGGTITQTVETTMGGATAPLVLRAGLTDAPATVSGPMAPRQTVVSPPPAASPVALDDHAVTLTADGAGFVAHAPAYTAVLDDQGIALTPQEPPQTVQTSRLTDGDHQLTLRVQQVQRGATTLPFPPATPQQAQGATVILERSAHLHETLVAAPTGVKHTLVLRQPLPGSGDVAVTYHLQTALTPQITAAQGVRFFTPQRGQQPARLTDVTLSPVVVYDAAGRHMTARLTLQGSQLRATVPATWLAQATYPVAIDPLVGTAATVSTGTSAPQQAVLNQIAVGQYMTLFTDARATALPRVYAQGFSVSGQRMGEPVVLSATTGAVPALSAALTATYTALGVWETPSGSGTTLVGQRLTLSSGKVGAPITLTAGLTTTVRPQVVSHAGTQTYLVVWSDTADGAVRGQRVASDGSLLGSAVTIFPAGTWDTTTQVTVHPTTQEYLVISATGSGILAQRVNASGSLVGSATTVATPSTTPQTVLVAAASGATGYLVAWDSAAGIVAQRLTTAAAPTGSLVTPVGVASGVPLPGQLVFNASRQEWLLAWTNAATQAVQAQRLDVTATVVGSAWTLAPASTTATAAVRVALDPAWQRYGVLWQEQQGGVVRLQGATVEAATGSLASGPLTIVDPRSVAGRAVAAYAVDQDAFVVAWPDVQGATTATLRLRTVTGTGVPTGTLTTLPGSLTTTPTAPALAAGGTGEPLLLVWQEETGSGTATIRAARVSQTGTVLETTPIAVSATSAVRRETPQVAYNPALHEYLVVWAERPGSQWQVYGQRIGVDGSLLGSPLLLAASGGTQPQVTYQPATGRYLVTWMTPTVYGQQVAADGSLVGSATQLSSATAKPATWLALATLPGTAGSMAVWTEYSHSGTGLFSTWARRLDASGQPVGSEILLSPEVAGHWQTGATLRADPAHGTYLALWADNYTIYGQRLSATGALQGGRITVAAPPTVKVDPTVVERGTSGEHLLLWRAAEEQTGYGVQAQRYQPVQAAFAATPSQPVGTVGFADTSTSPTAITSWQWDFGDGTTSTLQHPTHGYSPTGTYTVSLTVTSGGEWDTATQVVTVPGATQAQTTVIDYTYDGLHRLTGASSPGQVEGYTYDAVGNRLTATLNGATTQSYSYNAANQVVGWSYDAAGNLLSDGSQTYIYDALGRLTTATPAGQSAISYTYDGNGVLTAATQNSATTTYLQDTQAGLSQVLATTASGTTTEFLYGTERLASLTSGAYRWEYHDRQGSVRLELDNAGTVIQAPRYDAWGQVLSGTPSLFGYTGELQSAETGLQYLRARWYNPATGTLLGRDPFAGYDESPTSLHPYIYVYNDPIRFIDPTGNYKCDGYEECLDQLVDVGPECKETGNPFICLDLQDEVGGAIGIGRTLVKDVISIICSYKEDNFNAEEIVEGYFDSLKKILIVGESSTFEYTYKLRDHLKNTDFGGFSITSTVLDGNIPQNEGIELQFKSGIDATKLENNFQQDQFDYIIFNAPRPLKGWAPEGAELVKQFLTSSLNILKPGGSVYISSSSGMPATWKLKQLVSPGKTPTGYGNTFGPIPFLSDKYFGVSYQLFKNEGVPLNTPINWIDWYIFQK